MLKSIAELHFSWGSRETMDESSCSFIKSYHDENIEDPQNDANSNNIDEALNDSQKCDWYYIWGEIH